MVGVTLKDGVEDCLVFGGRAFASLLAWIAVHGKIPVAHGLVHQARAEAQQPRRTAAIEKQHVEGLVPIFPLLRYFASGLVRQTTLGARKTVEPDDKLILPGIVAICHRLAQGQRLEPDAGLYQFFEIRNRNWSDAEAAVASPGDKPLRRKSVQRLPHRHRADAVALGDGIDLEPLVRKQLAVQDIATNLVIGLFRQISAFLCARSCHATPPGRSDLFQNTNRRCIQTTVK